MPASAQRSRSPSTAAAVIAMTGRRGAPAAASAARIARVAAYPSSTGICTSISTASQPPRATASTAAWPSSTVSWS